jgi:hypothetical protein
MWTTVGLTWTTVGHNTVSSSEISEETIVAIHPIFWRVMNIENRR